MTVIEARGSTPREAGALMLVSRDETCGTIGGGRLEWDSVAEARAMLVAGEAARHRHIPLGPAINQCCGGAVTIRIEPVTDIEAEERAVMNEREHWPRLALFGAGHVGRALARVLSLLPLHLIWIDARGEEFGPVPPEIETRVTEDWESVLAALPVNAGVLVLTQSHTLDALIVGTALARDDLRYVGMIGSKTKRHSFEKGFREIGLTKKKIAKLVCPIGDFGVRDKRPEVIATLVAAEIAARFLNMPDKET